MPDQFGNPDNTRCHALTTGTELIGQLRAGGCTRLDWFVAGVGTGGTLMGVGQALRRAMPGVRIAAVEPEKPERYLTFDMFDTRNLSICLVLRSLKRLSSLLTEGTPLLKQCGLKLTEARGSCQAV